MSYITLYRKYRPKSFEEVVGQDMIVKILSNSILYNKIGHAYIFSGPRGTGKTSVAKIFAKAVNCLNNTIGDLCGKCDICNSDDNSSLDIIEIDAASNNGVDEIREIRNSVKLLPTMVKYKVYIIDEVHMLSSSAFNALLKTLEEPPQHVIFILATTELNKVPATVLSRCQKFEFKKITPKDIQQRLTIILKKEKRKLPEDVLELISKLGDGALRDAINITDQVLSLEKDKVTCDDIYDMIGEESEKSILDFFDSIIDGNINKGLSLISQTYEKGKNFLLLAERVQSLVRDIIIYINSPDYFGKEYDNVLDKYTIIDERLLINISEILFDMCISLKKPLNQKIVFETYYIKMMNVFSEAKEKELVASVPISEEKPIEEKTEIKIELKDKMITINNALAEAEVSLRKNMLNEYKEIEEYFPNKEYNSVAILMSGATPEVVSSRTIVFSFKEKKNVIIFDNKIEEIQKFLKIVFGKKYSIVALTIKEWEPLKKEFVDNIKKGKKYTYIKEEKANKNKSELESIFGDSIVTIK